jgi:hypothetical protein
VPALIETLLSTPDNVEVVRDQIAAILTVEVAKQGELGLSPVPRVFVERSNPWGQLLEEPADERPIINVWFDTASFDGSASSITERQKCDATFNVDVYAFGTSEADGADGHAPGDELAALACQRMLRLVRQILMSAHYTYLGLRGTVWKRWPQTLTMFRPTTDDRSAQNILAGRLALVVTFNEFSPQVAGEPLETLSLEVTRAGTGELYVAAQYPSPQGSQSHGN